RDLILQLSKSSIYSTKPFAALGELTAAAFNVENNLQLLEASITLAQVHGVEKDKIIKNADDLDAFMTA
ncbi:TPA: hypothetical protein IF111_005043, partial [Escherichia coli]|nr:hypothetical protein [Escherichia coli]HAO3189802.1 hypothetical protein [Escherichia coli]HDP7687881.1 hypothetical protein [Escherichia coli]HDP7863111.1 hypothetical protein [Escherichia coli]